jgi:hypothetical protein
MLGVRRVRVVCAVIVLGATLVGFAWLANYRVDMLVVSQRDDVAPLPSPLVGSPLDVVSAATGTLVRAPVWWGAYAAIILLLVGVGIALRIVQKRLRPVQRTSKLLLHSVRDERGPAQANRSLSDLAWLLRQLPRYALGGLNWFVVEPVRLLLKH